MTPLKESEEYGPTVQKDNQFGITLVLGAMPKSPAVIIGAIRQIELEGIQINKIIALETAAVMAGVHIASESVNKADWNLTQIYKELEKFEKKELQKKLEKIFSLKNKGRVSAEFLVANNDSGSWVFFDQSNYIEKIMPSLKGCGWIDDASESCLKPKTKETYLELTKNETVNPVVFLVKEFPGEQSENRFFIQFPENHNEQIDSSSRSKHLFLGKKYIKQELQKLKPWLKELKDKNESH
ncbi:MAG: hypothetical protein KA715_01675 [Xanthomonadaceae bacterium]|nr:hypothetical protein [Xanthomonadaceae bacterium]